MKCSNHTNIYTMGPFLLKSNPLYFEAKSLFILTGEVYWKMEVSIFAFIAIILYDKLFFRRYFIIIRYLVMSKNQEM